MKPCNGKLAITTFSILWMLEHDYQLKNRVYFLIQTKMRGDAKTILTDAEKLLYQLRIPK